VLTCASDAPRPAGSSVNEVVTPLLNFLERIS
jgi:hypothetical protein